MTEQIKCMHENSRGTSGDASALAIISVCIGTSDSDRKSDRPRISNAYGLALAFDLL